MTRQQGTACINCGHSVVENYCARCGQRRHHDRFSLFPLLQDAADSAFNLDQGLLRTVADLSRKPGTMAREYIAGRTRPFTNPAKYLIICVALATFASVASGFGAAPADTAIAERPDVADDLLRWSEFTQRYFNLMLLLGLPLLPLLSRLLFRSADFTLTEHLIFNAYVYAQQNLIFVALIPIFLIGGTDAIAVLYGIGITGYYVWACSGFFRLGLFATMIRAFVVMLLFSIAFVIGMLITALAVLAG